ncbi:hypothetical protein H0H81_010489 [Sphagnurus paluster]|uniref:Uncharacterized protein n=1 Tax=Sphagnurus paluster TaxID=117069 RepID=A0A9P7GHZ1_9AGAR|nr:hypothetical protein H0H81_010489 [Sphagnurus paluster]
MAQRIYGKDDCKDKFRNQNRGYSPSENGDFDSLQHILEVCPRLGFEAGDAKNLGTALDFIRDRNEKPYIKDKLHAVWLCTEIPTGGGRVVETATEEILKARSKGWFGDGKLRWRS